jgi:hypothetical protein
MAPSGIRISFSVLLRLRDDEEYVLFHSPSRPGAFGPPGGVIKYFPPAVRILEGLGFSEERGGPRPEVMKWDLRGYLPAGSVRRFLKWFDTGAYREDAEECLRRELTEELGEVGLSRLDDQVAGLSFTPVRTVVEGPEPVVGKPFRQLRRFEVYDLVTADSVALRLTRELSEAAADPSCPGVINVTRDDLRHGRKQAALIAPQSAFLAGGERMMPDVPAIP